MSYVRVSIRKTTFDGDVYHFECAFLFKLLLLLPQQKKKKISSEHFFTSPRKTCFFVLLKNWRKIMNRKKGGSEIWAFPRFLWSNFPLLPWLTHLKSRLLLESTSWAFYLTLGCVAMLSISSDCTGRDVSSAFSKLVIRDWTPNN